jgi:RND family efflux transporter MFP subunit
MGWIRKIHVREGEPVSTGDPLISIDDTDLQAKHKQAEAGIAEARAVLQNAEVAAARFQKLYAEKSVSKQKLDDMLTARERAAAGLQAALAQRDEIEVNLGYTDITATLDGIVARKMIEEGNMANPGESLLVVEQVDSMKVIAHLGERHVSNVTPGTPVNVDVTSLTDAQFTVPIDKVIPAAHPGSRTYDLEAYLPNPDGRLKSGMFARVNVPVGQRIAICVPPESILERGQLRGLFVVGEQDRVRLRWVRLGRSGPFGVEVLSGLEGNETIVVSSQIPLREGDRVVR